MKVSRGSRLEPLAGLVAVVDIADVARHLVEIAILLRQALDLCSVGGFGPADVLLHRLQIVLGCLSQMNPQVASPICA